MALARVKTWNAAETLTASDLNAEFNNICNHFGSLDNDDIDSTASYVMGELIVGSGITSADGGQLHVHTGSAGTIQASGDADEAVFENSGASGVTILSGTTSTGNIAFGDSGDADNGLLKYTHGATPTLGITVNATAVQSIAAAATTLAHDLAIYQDANNADSQIALGTGAAEALFVEALNGAGNKTLEELRFTTKTASGTANHGKMSWYVDEVNIGNVNDAGITLESGMIFAGNLTGNVTGNTSGTAATVTSGTQAAITTTANLVTVGTIGTGVWQGTAVASAYLDADTAHLSTTQTFTGAKTFSAAAQFSNTLTVGVNGTGYDVQLFGDTAGSSVLWDQSEDDLVLTNAGLAVGSDATGDVYFRNASGFLARLAASTDGHVLTTGGAGTVPAWEAVSAGVSLSGSTNNTIATVTGANALIGEAELTFDGLDLAIGNAAPSSYMNSVHGLIVGDTGDATSEITIATSTSGVGELNFTDTADTTNQGGLTYTHSNNHLAFATNGGTGMTLGGSGDLYISGDASNAFQTTGMTIDQGANDNEILAFKSSDVAHGMTSWTETDTYARFQKGTGTGGGLDFVGFVDNGGTATGILARAFGGAVNTAKTVDAIGAITLYGGYNNTSAGGADLTSDGNLLAIGNAVGGATRFIFDVEGTGHADVAWTTYDTYDDLTLISDMEDTLLAMETPDQTPRRHAMEATGIIGKGSWHIEDGKPRAMVNFTKLAMLHHGALIQTGDRFKMLEDRLEATEAKLLLAQSKLDKLEIN